MRKASHRWWCSAPTVVSCGEGHHDEHRGFRRTCCARVCIGRRQPHRPPRVRDDVGNVAVPVETIVMVVEPVGVFGDVNLSQPTPSSLGVSWDVHTDEPFANLTVSLNGTAIHQASIEEGAAPDLRSARGCGGRPDRGCKEHLSEDDVCHTTALPCLTNTTTLDLTDLQDLGLGGTCIDAVPDGNATDILVCQLQNNGLRQLWCRGPLRWRRRGRMDLHPPTWCRADVVGGQPCVHPPQRGPPGHASLVGVLVADRCPRGRAHHRAPRRELLSPPAEDGDQQSTSDDGSEASSGRDGMMLLIVFVMALLGIVALVLTLRISSRQHAVGREDDVTLPHASLQRRLRGRARNTWNPHPSIPKPRRITPVCLSKGTARRTR